MRFRITGTNPARIIDRSHDIARAHGLTLRNFEIDRARHQQAAGSDNPPDPPPRERRVPARGHLVIEMLGIAILQIVRNARFRPQDQTCRSRLLWQAQGSDAGKLRTPEPPGIPGSDGYLRHRRGTQHL